MDPRLLTAVSSAVAKAAISTGVARQEITDWEEYEDNLSNMLGYSNKLMNEISPILLRLRLRGWYIAKETILILSKQLS